MNEPPPRQVRSDEETLGEIFNGSPYAVDADVSVERVAACVEFNHWFGWS